MNIKEDFYVIGVGLPRTGTMSMKAALEMILPGKCTHMYEAIKYSEEWGRICEDKANDDELKQFLLSNGFTSGVDAPFIFYYERLMKIFPNAKVILTVRDPTKWTESMRATVCLSYIYLKSLPIMLVHWLRPVTRYLQYNTVLPTKVEKIKDFREMLKACSDGRGEKFFNQWTERIKETIPREKLLIFNVAEGWKPLCEALDVSVPEIPFPRVNDSKEYGQRLAKIKHDTYKVIAKVSLTVLIIVSTLIILCILFM